MELIRDIDKDIIKYAMVKSLVEFATVSNIYLIAEGIETVDELKTLIELGVPYGQGYFLRTVCGIGEGKRICTYSNP